MGMRSNVAAFAIEIFTNFRFHFSNDCRNDGKYVLMQNMIHQPQRRKTVISSCHSARKIWISMEIRFADRNRSTASFFCSASFSLRAVSTMMWCVCTVAKIWVLRKHKHTKQIYFGPKKLFSVSSAHRQPNFYVKIKVMHAHAQYPFHVLKKIIWFFNPRRCIFYHHDPSWSWIGLCKIDASMYDHPRATHRLNIAEFKCNLSSPPPPPILTDNGRYEKKRLRGHKSYLGNCIH